MTGRTRASLVLTLLPLVAFGAACSGSADAGTSESDSAAGARIINVEVRTIERTEFSERIRLTGTVSANRDVTIAAEESGVIRELPVAKGSTVSAGQVIARIDDRILRAQVAQARAQSELAKEVADRRSRLFTEDSIGSELVVLEARSAAQQAAANLEGLTERLNRTAIRAPVSGVLESREVEVGSMVGSGTPVARIIQLNPAKIVAGVPERFAGDVGPGTTARITFDVLPDRVFEARISYVGIAVNPRNRTFPVEVVLPNVSRAIKPEMVANLELVRQSLRQAIVIPQEAMVRVENGFVAYVVEEREGRPVARVRPLTLGPSQRNQVVVESGLEVGDRLVVVGQQQLASGDRVAIVSSGRVGDSAGPEGVR
ncbi:MAG TPA: efflux RND transporter periplasmic adaptor subunit [Gemmatimonadaceae bacterium]|nr:efflux RND transporter periplasmic adaptor subunit [Gemmatimonadaceae bacterium]